MKIEFEKWWHEVGSGLVKAETEDNEEHARRVSKAAYEFACREIGLCTAVARVTETDDFSAEVSWILNPLPPGTLLFDTPNTAAGQYGQSTESALGM